jgi:hypothetical protein
MATYSTSEFKDDLEPTPELTGAVSRHQGLRNAKQEGLPRRRYGGHVRLNSKSE